MNIRELGVLLALGAVWGSSFMFIKVGGEGLQPFALVEVRLGLAAFTMLAAGSLNRRTWPLFRKYWRPLVVMGVINCALPYTLFAWGEIYINSGLAAIYNATTPLWTGALGLIWASAERLTPGKTVGLFIGLAGVVLVVSGDLAVEGASSEQLLGQGAVLLAGLSYAVSGIYGGKSLRGVPPRIPASGQLIAGAIILLPLAAFQIPGSVPSIRAIGAVSMLAITNTALASMMYYWLLTHIGTVKTVLVTYLLPGFALLWGAIFLDEAVTLPAVAGLLLILLGISVTSGGGLGFLARLRNRDVHRHVEPGA